MTSVVLVDTNIVVDVLQEDPVWAEWSANQMRTLKLMHRLAINPVIYAELAMSFDSIDDLDATLATGGLQLEEMPRPALFLAAKAHKAYRQRGGTRNQVLPDFFIGAHAATNRWALLSRDRARYTTYFPTLRVIAPDS